MDCCVRSCDPVYNKDLDKCQDMRSTSTITKYAPVSRIVDEQRLYCSLGVEMTPNQTTTTAEKEVNPTSKPLA